MMIEGRGSVAPGAEIIRLSRSDVELVRRIADERSAYRNYSNRPDTWGRGVVSDPAFYGLLGEHAACVYINRRAGLRLEVDRQLKSLGDGGVDITASDVSIDVKARVSGKHFLVRRLNDRKKILSLNADAFVFAQCTGTRTIALMGWMTRGEVRESRLTKSPRGDWFNLEIDETRLRSMRCLIEKIKLRRAA